MICLTCNVDFINPTKIKYKYCPKCRKDFGKVMRQIKQEYELKQRGVYNGIYDEDNFRREK